MLNAVLAGFVLAVLAPAVARQVPRYSGAILALLPAGLFVWFLRNAEVALGPGLIEQWPWSPLPGVALTFRLDGLSLLMALIISGVGALILVYAGGYMQGAASAGRLYALLLAFMASMLGLVLSDNLIALFVFWELTSVTSFLLIGWHFHEERSRAAALQALIVTAGGGLALLAGFVLIGLVGGTWEISALTAQASTLQGSELYLPILLLLWLGAASKSAQFPFHFWLPGAMAAPTPVSAYLHSATMVKAGVYLLARLSPALAGTNEWSLIFMVTGLVTLLLGGYLSLKQDDMKRMLAYSTVSSLGLLVTLLGLGTKLAIEAATLYLLAHALYKGALFMVAGAIDHATGTRDLRRLRGLAGAMPTSALAATLAALSMAGLPFLVGFAAKEIIYEASLLSGAGAWLLTLLLLAGNVAFVYVAQQMLLRPFRGEALRYEHFHAPGVGLWAGPLLLAGLGLALGLLPNVTAELASGAATAIYGAPAALHLFLLPGSINTMVLLSALDPRRRHPALPATGDAGALAGLAGRGAAAGAGACLPADAGGAAATGGAHHRVAAERAPAFLRTYDCNCLAAVAGADLGCARRVGAAGGPAGAAGGHALPRDHSGAGDPRRAGQRDARQLATGADHLAGRGWLRHGHRLYPFRRAGPGDDAVRDRDAGRDPLRAGALPPAGHGAALVATRAAARRCGGGAGGSGDDVDDPGDHRRAVAFAAEGLVRPASASPWATATTSST